MANQTSCWTKCLTSGIGRTIQAQPSLSRMFLAGAVAGTSIGLLRNLKSNPQVLTAGLWLGGGIGSSGLQLALAAGVPTASEVTPLSAPANLSISPHISFADGPSIRRGEGELAWTRVRGTVQAQPAGSTLQSQTSHVWQIWTVDGAGAVHNKNGRVTEGSR